MGQQLALGARVYPKPTEDAIAAVKAKRSAGGKMTKEDRVLLILEDGEWHGAAELADKVSWRFGGYLHTLKQKGVSWEKERVQEVRDAQVFRYRLCEDA